MTARIPFVAGNWKLNGGLAANDALLAGLLESLADLRTGPGAADAATASDGARPQVEVAVCPPFPYLAQVGARLQGRPFGWGAQDVSEHDSGAYTGEVAAPMLAELGCRWGIVGHSERRTLHGETDAQVARKTGRLLAAGVRPIVCVGETLEQREAGDTEAVLARQVDAVVAVLAGAGTLPVVAYEPVWAIGTGRTATPEMAQQAHAFIRARLAAGGADAAGIRLLYGGSVKPGNAAQLFAQPDIDGGLIGGAALVAADFAAICRAAADA